MTKNRKYAEILVEREKQASTLELRKAYNVMGQHFKKIFLEDDDRPHIVATLNNKEQVFRILQRKGDTIIATQKEEKSSTLRPYKLDINKNNIRFASLEDLINHNEI